MKVIFVCQFSNANVRAHLPLGERKLYYWFRKVLGLPTKEYGYGDVAGWNTYMIELLRQRDDLDLCVISAHGGMKRRVTHFYLDGVQYYFLRLEGATLLKHLIPSPSVWHCLNPLRPTVRRIVKRINPDILALIGAENPHISGTVLGIKGIPLIVKCQTIYNNPERIKTGQLDSKNAYVERLIFKDLRYVAAGTGIYGRLFRDFNKTAFNFKWPLGNLLPEVKPLEKEFDFVNYAMAMSEQKGFPDVIQALAIVKKEYPDVKLNLVGGGTKEAKESLHRLVDDLGLAENVSFTPFFEKQEDMFQHIQKARFAALPCKLDTISSTIRQAMHYELPLVCYKTDGTLRLNQEKECVLLAENGDVNDLAAKMLLMLREKERMEKMKFNAKVFSRHWNDDEGNLRKMVDIFYAVVDHYRYGVPIPEQLLHDETK